MIRYLLPFLALCYYAQADEDKVDNRVNPWTHYTDLFSDKNCENMIEAAMKTEADLGYCGGNGAGLPVVYECWDPKMDDEHMKIIEAPYKNMKCEITAKQGAYKPKMLWTRGECYTFPDGAMPCIGPLPCPQSFIVNWEGKTPCPRSWANSGLVSKLCQIVNCGEEAIVGDISLTSTDHTVLLIGTLLALFGA